MSVILLQILLKEKAASREGRELKLPDLGLFSKITKSKFVLHLLIYSISCSLLHLIVHHSN